MGQQQLLLIVLGVIIVGVAVTLGISVFNANSASNKRDILLNECMHLATLAQKYYRIPKALAGGGREFTNWEIPNRLITSDNGSFTAIVNAASVKITGTGNEDVANGEAIEVQVEVLPDKAEVVSLK